MRLDPADAVGDPTAWSLKMAPPVVLGIVGTGRMAATMVRTARTVPDVRIAAVASGDPARAARFGEHFGIAHASASVADLVARPDIDAIYVANRSADHVKAARTALAVGKPVLVEKPFALNQDEGAELIAEARARGCLLIENLWCLTLPAYLELGARFRSGVYGRAVHLSFDFGYPMDGTSYPSLFETSYGGVLHDRATYGISLALSLLGPVKTLRSSVVSDSSGLDLAAGIQLTHESGAVSQLAFAINALMSNRATLACTKGVLHLEAPTIGAEAVAGRRIAPLTAPDILQPPDGRARLVARLRTIPTLRRLNRWMSNPSLTRRPYGPDPYCMALRHFCEQVRARARESPLIPLDLSLGTLRLVQAARDADHATLER